MTFPLIFPLTFASSIFVRPASMPGWLQGFAVHQPVSECATAVRGLMLGTAHGDATWITLAWSIGAIALLAPLATAQYRKVA
jgi:ABC-type multidrug transport system permease subunit